MYLCINRVTTNDYYHRHMSLIQLSESFRASHPLIKLKVGTVFSKISINVNSSKTIFLRLFYHHSSSLCSVLPPSVYQSPIQTLHTHTQWVWTKCSCRSRSLSLPPTSTLPPILLFYILSHFPLLLFFFKIIDILHLYKTDKTGNWHFHILPFVRECDTGVVIGWCIWGVFRVFHGINTWKMQKVTAIGKGRR